MGWVGEGRLGGYGRWWARVLFVPFPIRCCREGKITPDGEMDDICVYLRASAVNAWAEGEPFLQRCAQAHSHAEFGGCCLALGRPRNASPLQAIRGWQAQQQ